MSRWESLGTWVGPTVNTGGNMGKIRGVVLHIAQGSYDGTISWQRQKRARTSSHFIVSKAGSIAQMVDTSRVAWCQGAGNLAWLSIEFAAFVPEALTDAQLQAAAKILAEAHKRYGVPLQLANTPGGRGLGWHGMGGAKWGGHPDCPGPAIIRQRPEIIRRAKRIAKPPSAYIRVIIKRGDTVSGIATRYGWKLWQSVWNDVRNAELRRRRGRPENIQPGDVLHVRRKG